MNTLELLAAELADLAELTFTVARDRGNVPLLATIVIGAGAHVAQLHPQLSDDPVSRRALAAVLRVIADDLEESA